MVILTSIVFIYRRATKAWQRNHFSEILLLRSTNGILLGIQWKDLTSSTLATLFSDKPSVDLLIDSLKVRVLLIL